MKLIRAIVAFCVFLALLVVVYVVHVNFLTVDVVFYSALFDVALATSLAGLSLFTLRFFEALAGFEKGLMVIIMCLSGYVLAISVPTVIDRSLSFYLLEKIDQRGGGIMLSGFENVITDEFMKEHRLVDARITEQRASGTIVIVNGCVQLTDRGKRLVRFSHFFRQHLLPKRRLLMDEYTGDLTDPFRHSERVEDYLCGQ